MSDTPSVDAPERSSERGFALTLALLVLLLTSIALTLTAFALELRLREHAQRVERLRLLASSDAVLAETLARLDRDEGFTGVARRPLEQLGGWCESQVFPLGRQSRRVVVNCERGGRRHRVEARLQLGETGPTVESWRRR